MFFSSIYYFLSESFHKKNPNVDQGRLVLLVFYPGDLNDSSDVTMNLLSDLALAPELDLALITVSTDSIKTHEVWAGRRENGAPPVIMIADKPGAIARSVYIPS